ncbi:phosphotransferase family protein [Rhodococcus spongiicola]|uniref:Phosphotransferase family protein n=1 Tax=Rhodococcus spongiicola TaxID=2487352 RepID=A0A3S3BJ26_9NOCA|nr:phosphotransferase family protein [Rhodococcus spongiicola]RVW02469.1 phosphotransferase family protein [Rhodococcus spongiicola]
MSFEHTNNGRDYSEMARPGESRTDPAEIADRLQRWLRTKLPADVEPAVTDVQVPDANGMSSETILFDVLWHEDGEIRRHGLVARIAPAPSAVPVFPSYDMDQQYQVIKTVGILSSVPVPRVHWSETSPAALGGEFFVMDRVDGQIPPDVMPYTFGSWLSEASPADRRRLQDSSVRVLAELHSIPEPAQLFPALSPDPGSDDVTADAALCAHVNRLHRYYEWVVETTPRSPLIERGLEWLDEHWPTVTGPAVLCWGDARVGNIIYRDFEPVAVLDWEMATLGPRELDLGWMVFLHRFFEDLAGVAGLPGLPDFLRRDDVAETYRNLTGYSTTDLDFFTLYAALRHAIIMFRVQSRAVAFGQAEAPDDPDDMILHRTTLERMLDGTYWNGPNEKGVA